MVRNAALGVTVMFFFIFAFYSYSFYFGSLLRDSRTMNGSEIYTGGAIIATMFSVIFGSFGLGGAGPHLKSVTEGRIAGKLAFDTIDHVPLVKADEADTIILKAGDIHGLIEFKDVSFSYPSR
jgi:ABC-type multidrug transport system fused ATPase/permease subunit